MKREIKLIEDSNGSLETSGGLGLVKASSIIGKNVLINGGFDIWQRGGVLPQSFGSAGNNAVYTADRWFMNQPNGAAQVYQGSTTDPTVVDQFRGTTLVHDVILSGSGFIAQRIENVRILSGKKATLSFWVNGVTSAKTFDVGLSQVFGTSGSATVDIPTQSVTADFGVWKKVTLTFDIPSIQGKTIGDGSYLELYIKSGLTSGRVDFGNIQFEEGEVATEFEQRPIGTELSLCQRYFYAVVNIPGFNTNSSSTNTTLRVPILSFPVTMLREPDIQNVVGTPNSMVGNWEQSFTSTPHGLTYIGLSASSTATGRVHSLGVDLDAEIY